MPPDVAATVNLHASDRLSCYLMSFRYNLHASGRLSCSKSYTCYYMPSVTLVAVWLHASGWVSCLRMSSMPPVGLHASGRASCLRTSFMPPDELHASGWVSCLRSLELHQILYMLLHASGRSSYSQPSCLQSFEQLTSFMPPVIAASVLNSHASGQTQATCLRSS